jgi:hypothetical protein
MCAHGCLHEQETLYRMSAPLEDQRLTNEAEQLAAKVCQRWMLSELGNRHASGGKRQPKTSGILREDRIQAANENQKTSGNEKSGRAAPAPGEPERGKTDTFAHGLKNQCYAWAHRRKIAKRKIWPVTSREKVKEKSTRTLQGTESMPGTQAQHTGAKICA